MRELNTFAPREPQFVEPLERLPPLALRLSGRANCALRGGWVGDPLGRPAHENQGSISIQGSTLDPVC
eukprot:10508247-Heterocapsa_arctica.AAC.1